MIDWLINNYIELIGIIASAIVVVSMAAKTTTYKGTLFMRITNIIGCLIFFIYGLLIGSSSVIILNIFCLALDVVYIITEARDNRKNK